jgi:hypothetical protein
MNKKYLYALLVLLVVLALLWNKCRRVDQNETQDSARKEVNLESTIDDSKNPTNKAGSKQPLTRLEKIRDFLKDADAQIDFYGRVIDQEGVGVQGATINYQLERAGKLMAAGDIVNNNEKATCLSTEDGFFSIQEAKGLTLTILSIEKEGYRDGKQNLNSFGYRGTPELHNADLTTPVNFLLISNNIPKTKKLLDKLLTFSWNQGPVEIPIPSVGKIKILPERNWTSGQLRLFDWQVEISMDGAELVEIEMGQAKIAPVDGYQKSYKYGSKKEDLQWVGAVRRHYAFRTTGGLYGFINFDLSPDREVEDQSTSLEVRLNESGSRNID